MEGLKGEEGHPSTARGDVHGGVSQGYRRRCREESNQCMAKRGHEEPGTRLWEGQKHLQYPPKRTLPP